MNIPDQAEKLLKTALFGVKLNFSRGKQLMPVLICVNGDKIEVIGVPFKNSAEKAMVSKLISLKSKESDCCVFISEIWTAQAKTREEVINSVPPSLRADRGESVMVQLMIKNRVIFHMAEITRAPDKLGEFKLVGDSADPDFKYESLLFPDAQN